MGHQHGLGRGAGILAVAALLLALCRVAAATDAPAAGDDAARPAENNAGAAAIATDLLIGRPTSLMATVGGALFYALSLPITAPSGSSDEALELFVKQPVHHLTGPLGE